MFFDETSKVGMVSKAHGNGTVGTVTNGKLGTSGGQGYC